MSILYALVRLIFMGTIFILGMLLTLLLLLVPIRTKRGMRLASLPIYWMDHLFLWTFNIQYHCSNPEVLRQHQGMILCNHLSYVDPMIPSAITPIRFLAAAGVRRVPLVNLIALALDTVYVNRGNKTSRSQARQAVAQQLKSRPYPPLMLYPEGKISDGSQMFPFRHGAFEIVLEQDISCLLCAVRYDPLSVVTYYDRMQGRWLRWLMKPSRNTYRSKLPLVAEPASVYPC